MSAFSSIEAFYADPGSLYVLGIVEGRDRAEELLDGWAEACGGVDSLGWVVDRVGAPPTHQRIA